MDPRLGKFKMFSYRVEGGEKIELTPMPVSID